MIVSPYLAKTTETVYGHNFSNLVYDGVLVQDTEQTLTVPSNAPKYKVIFTYSVAGSTWVALNATAAKAVGGIAAGVSILDPDCREVKAGDVLHFITGLAAGVTIGIEFYAL